MENNQGSQGGSEGQSGGSQGGAKGNQGGSEGFAKGVATGESFLNTLPEEFRAEPSLKSIKDMNGLVKSYVNAQKMIGKGIHLPGEDADAETMQAFYNKIGRPENPSDYEFEEGSFERDPETMEALKKELHESGLTKAQAKEFMKRFDGFAEKIQDDKAASAEKEEVSFVQAAHDQYGGEDGWAKVMAETELFLVNNVPQEIRANFEGLGSKELLTVVSTVQHVLNSKKEGQPLESQNQNAEPMKSALEYKDELHKLMKNPEYGRPSLEGQNLKKDGRRLTALMIKAEQRK